jgi:hypothetical protein
VRTSSVVRFWLGAVVAIGMWSGDALAKGEHVKSDHAMDTTGAGDLGGESVDSFILIQCHWPNHHARPDYYVYSLLLAANRCASKQ